MPQRLAAPSLTRRASLSCTTSSSLGQRPGFRRADASRPAFRRADARRWQLGTCGFKCCSGWRGAVSDAPRPFMYYSSSTRCVQCLRVLYKSVRYFPRGKCHRESSFPLAGQPPQEKLPSRGGGNGAGPRIGSGPLECQPPLGIIRARTSGRHLPHPFPSHHFTALLPSRVASFCDVRRAWRHLRLARGFNSRGQFPPFSPASNQRPRAAADG